MLTLISIGWYSFSDVSSTQREIISVASTAPSQHWKWSRYQITANRLQTASRLKWSSSCIIYLKIRTRLKTRWSLYCAFYSKIVDDKSFSLIAANKPVDIKFHNFHLRSMKNMLQPSNIYNSMKIESNLNFQFSSN